MPPRRTTTRRNASSTQQQSTLSFHGKPNRITKHTTSPRNAKSIKADPALLDEVSVTQSIKSEADPDPKEHPTTTTTEKATVEPTPTEAPAPDPLADSSTSPAIKTEDVLGGRAEAGADSTGATGGRTGSGWVGDEEQTARKISETQIKRYWRQKEAERLAPRVHQEGLGVHEKVLREWDMSGQYGPCIGIARLKRWKRANVLGLKPPIEVLAVLLKDLDDGDAKAQRAHVDELMTSRFTEV